MRFLTVMIGLPFLLAFPHPFAQQGSTDNDSTLLQERTEMAEENRRQHQEALEFIEQQKEEQNQQADDGAERRELNEAEKLVE